MSVLVMMVLSVLSLCVAMPLRSFPHKFTHEGLHIPIVSIFKGKSNDGREERGDDDILRDDEPQLPRCG